MIEQNIKHSHNCLFSSLCINCLGLKINITHKPRCRIRLPLFNGGGRIVHGKEANQPDCEQARELTGKGAKKPDTLGLQYVIFYSGRTIICAVGYRLIWPPVGWYRLTENRIISVIFSMHAYCVQKITAKIFTEGFQK